MSEYEIRCDPSAFKQSSYFSPEEILEQFGGKELTPELISEIKEWAENAALDEAYENASFSVVQNDLDEFDNWLREIFELDEQGYYDEEGG